MRAIITVEESTSMRGRFYLSVQARGLKRPIKRDEAGQGPEAAAASAMQAAISFGGTGYHIFAPKKVLDLIPNDMRSRA